MEDLFSDIPSAIENTIEIAKRCNVQLTLGDIAMPIFPLDDNQNENEYFHSLVMQSLNKKNYFSRRIKNNPYLIIASNKNNLIKKTIVDNWDTSYLDGDCMI